MDSNNEKLVVSYIYDIWTKVHCRKYCGVMVRKSCLVHNVKKHLCHDWWAKFVYFNLFPVLSGSLLSFPPALFLQVQQTSPTGLP